METNQSENHSENRVRKPNQAFVTKNKDFIAWRDEAKKMPTDIDDVTALLTLLLPLLRIFLAENLYRYILGVIAHHTILSQKDLAICGECCDKTVRKGSEEYHIGIIPSFDRQRRRGGGRKKLYRKKPEILSTIRDFISNSIYGTCTKTLRQYTSSTLKSIREAVASHLNINISPTTISSYLKTLGIRKKKNRKTECCSHTEETKEQKEICDAQFEFIGKMKEELKDRQDVPQLSIDCKRKEVLGPFAARGTCYVQNGQEIKVCDHDFMVPLNVSTLTGIDDLLSRQEGKAIPYGTYDIRKKKGYVYVGLSHDSAESAVAAIEHYIHDILRDYPHAPYIVISADGGGSNGARSRAFKYEMALLSDRIGIPIYVIHYPPYKSKYNAIERCLFAPISRSFDGHPLYDLREVLSLIRSTTTETGLTVQADLDTSIYETGRKITKEEFDAIDITYIGPTQNNSVHLSYIINGTKDHRGLNSLPERKTVFDITENIDKTEEEKAAEKKSKSRRKTAETRKVSATAAA